MARGGAWGVEGEHQGPQVLARDGLVRGLDVEYRPAKPTPEEAAPPRATAQERASFLLSACAYRQNYKPNALKTKSRKLCIAGAEAMHIDLPY